ncbi:MAG: TonB-dependent receptor [Methylotenera sp.]|nr:TonB-dependent receptor [Methylotenera sp.]
MQVFKLNVISSALVLAGLLSVSTLVFAESSERANAIITAPVVVTGTRVEQNSFDLPMSINAISGEDIREGQQQVHLSETAARIPGVVVNNRNHGAQELSISTRGFGPRAQFGVRGIRLYADGIPLTMPDGQGQTGTFNLDTADRIEFLRGPFSALYGNSSGGVVQIFTKNGGPENELSGTAFYGSYSTHREALTYSGKMDKVDYVLNASHYETNGYRTHSANKRDMLHAKIGIQLSDDSKITLVVTDLDQPDTKDPGGLTLAEFKRDPSLARTNAVANNMHKEIKHTQAGVILDHKISDTDLIKVTAYYGTRENLQFLFNNTASGYDRDFGGTDIRWNHSGQLADRPFNFTAGINYDSMRDDRYNYGGTKKGNIVSTSTLNRSEINKAYNVDQYAQAEWKFHDQWDLHAGIRHSRVTFDNTDKKAHAYDDKITYAKTMPVVGMTYKVTPVFNLYANAGKGFETPTFVEQAYNDDTSPTGNNPNIKPSSSTNYEIGAKAFLTDSTLLNLAIFNVKTEKEIVVDSGNVVTVYKNAGDTERKGLELSLDSDLGNNFKGYLAYTYLNAEFKDAFGLVESGNKIPGTYSDRIYAELSWKHPDSGFNTAIEGIHSSKTYVNDTNTAEADAYTVFNWRGGFTQKVNNWKFNEFVRLENITNRDYIVNVRSNDSGLRFYEPGLPSNWAVGLNASYIF